MNCQNPRIYKIFDIADKFCMLRLLKDHYDIFGIRMYQVYLLRKIIKATGAKVVLSSSWRHGWDKPYKYCDSRMKSLKRNFWLFRITVYGITGRSKTGNRETEIREWISIQNAVGDSVDRFVILDDEKSDLIGFVGKELIQTSNVDRIMGRRCEDTGLKQKHVKVAISILNDESEKCNHTNYSNVYRRHR